MVLVEHWDSTRWLHNGLIFEKAVSVYQADLNPAVYCTDERLEQRRYSDL